MKKILKNLSDTTITKIVESLNLKKFKLSDTSCLYIEGDIPTNCPQLTKYSPRSLIVDDGILFTMPVVLQFWWTTVERKKRWRAAIGPHNLGDYCQRTWLSTYESIITDYNIESLTVQRRLADSGNNKICDLGTGKLTDHRDIFIVKRNLKWEVL